MSLKQAQALHRLPQSSAEADSNGKIWEVDDFLVFDSDIFDGMALLDLTQEEMLYIQEGASRGLSVLPVRYLGAGGGWRGSESLLFSRRSPCFRRHNAH